MSGGSRQGWRGRRIIVRAGEMISVYRPRRCADDNQEALDCLILGSPQREKPICVMGRHPVAQKPCGGRDDSLSTVDLLQLHRLQPLAEGVLATFRPQLTENPNPLRLACCRRVGCTFLLNCLRHPSTPIHRTDAMPAVRRQYFFLQRPTICGSTTLLNTGRDLPPCR